METFEKPRLENEKPEKINRREAIKKITMATAAMAFLPEEVLAAEEKSYEDWSLEELYQDNLKYLHYYFEQLRLKLAYDAKKHQKNREIIDKLKTYHHQLEGETNLDRFKTPLEVALAMEAEAYDFVIKDHETPRHLSKRIFRNFTFRLIDIIRPYL